MRKFFRSSFFVLTVIALLAGIIGAFLTGWFDLNPGPQERAGYLQLLDGVTMGILSVCIGLLPYWTFHILIGDITDSWMQIENKVRRVTWVVCWAGFLGFMIPAYWLTLFYAT